MPKKYSVVFFNDEAVEIEVLARERDVVVLKDPGGRIYRVRVLKEGDGRYVLYIDDRMVSAGVIGDKVYVNLEPLLVKKVKETVAAAKAVERKEEKQTPAAMEEGVVSTPISGRVVEVKVAEGQSIGENDVVAVVESMKMLIEVKTPFKGVVEAVYVKPGSTVNKGDKLVKVKTRS
ncbi:biotin/lipoyl-containing protein [Desulfurococcus mucosus]|uniref:Biotin/lipoyl attachment domain-containing protein n=1 Tax=Desulfurococcus mucosus (strain ATCC 35584 / DSM 2162 / JCM 9187 / O7/1) TaxID=765177 RepID=E8R880_DESM0|nr:biotin/lipoyl-containing protein [Desulfurococcus mucosus]ADV64706.1 biotin/lipoyl attachment domain-containing protein [Desulfurococcus mucosus DSM 2162]